MFHHLAKLHYTHDCCCSNVAKPISDASVQNITDDVCWAAALGLLPLTCPLLDMWVCVCCCSIVKTLELFLFALSAPLSLEQHVGAIQTLASTQTDLNLLRVGCLPDCLVAFLAPAFWLPSEAEFVMASALSVPVTLLVQLTF